MPRKAAAIKGHAGVNQRQVQRVPDQVVDQYRNPADSQSFVDKLAPVPAETDGA